MKKKLYIFCLLWFCFMKPEYNEQKLISKKKKENYIITMTNLSTNDRDINPLLVKYYLLPFILITYVPINDFINQYE